MTCRNVKGCAAVLICALIASPAAFSQAVTYDFTGAATFGGFGFGPGLIPVGTPVSGTYTFDYSDHLEGAIGSAEWSVSSEAPLFYSGPAPNPLVFSSTSQVGGSELGDFEYTTLVPALVSSPPSSTVVPQIVLSAVQGATNGSESSFTASESWAIAPDYVGGSSLSIFNPHGAYSPNGLPILAGATSAVGEFGGLFAGEAAQVNFKITSLTPASVTAAPEMDSSTAYAAITLLIGSLLVVRSTKTRRGLRI